MSAVKLTKNELKKQKDALKRFQRYLPTLQLKKQQLQMIIRQVEQEHDALAREKDNRRRRLESWIGLFHDHTRPEDYVRPERVRTGSGNIAGVDIPIFEELTFADVRWNLLETPLWIDSGVDALKTLVEYDARLRVLDEQLRRLGAELRTTTQRVNLFEKVKIPETKEHIRKIRIYLGDQQTAAVVRGKISKQNLVRAEA